MFTLRFTIDLFNVYVYTPAYIYIYIYTYTEICTDKVRYSIHLFPRAHAPSFSQHHSSNPTQLPRIRATCTTGSSGWIRRTGRGSAAWYSRAETCEQDGSSCRSNTCRRRIIDLNSTVLGWRSRCAYVGLPAGIFDSNGSTQGIDKVEYPVAMVLQLCTCIEGVISKPPHCHHYKF